MHWHGCRTGERGIRESFGPSGPPAAGRTGFCKELVKTLAGRISGLVQEVRAEVGAPCTLVEGWPAILVEDLSWFWREARCKRSGLERESTLYLGRRLASYPGVEVSWF